VTSIKEADSFRTSILRNRSQKQLTVPTDQKKAEGEEVFWRGEKDKSKLLQKGPTRKSPIQETLVGENPF